MFRRNGKRLGAQRDRLEDERRQIAATRNREPIIAESIKAIGLLIACLVPLLIALQILRRSDTPDESAAVAELLLSDMVADRPTIVRIVDATPKESSVMQLVELPTAEILTQSQ